MAPSIPITRTGVRRSPRFKVNFLIKLFAVVQQRRCVLQGRSHDLSLEGMAIYIPAELEAGQAVQIEFTIPETNQRLGVHGVVRNSGGFRCGVEFRGLTPIDQAALRQHCEALSAASTSQDCTEGAVPETETVSSPRQTPALL